MIPGEYILRSEPIEANVGRETVEIEVANHGDRPIQVGSHMHFSKSTRPWCFRVAWRLVSISTFQPGRGAFRARRPQASDARGVCWHRRGVWAQ